MMDGRFTSRLDPCRALLHTTLTGFFSIADVRRYEIERNHALARLGAGPNRHRTLCDVSGCQLSTAEVVAELQRVIGDPRYRSLHCAMIVPGTLAKMQARRAVGRTDVAMFDTAAQAEAWLFDHDARAVA